MTSPGLVTTQIGGDARLANIQAGSLNVTGSQETEAPDRRLGALDRRVDHSRDHAQIIRFCAASD
jgi:hypothetical protein